MLTIQSFCFNAFQENTFVLFNAEKEAIIIDPGCYLKHEEAQLANFIADNHLTPTLLLNTHCHFRPCIWEQFCKRHLWIDCFYFIKKNKQ